MGEPITCDNFSNLGFAFPKLIEGEPAGPFLDMHSAKVVLLHLVTQGESDNHEKHLQLIRSVQLGCEVHDLVQQLLSE